MASLIGIVLSVESEFAGNAKELGLRSIAPLAIHIVLLEVDVGIEDIVVYFLAEGGLPLLHSPPVEGLFSIVVNQVVSLIEDGLVVWVGSTVFDRLVESFESNEKCLHVIGITCDAVHRHFVVVLLLVSLRAVPQVGQVAEGEYQTG